ncbi:MAG: hypothetical protein ACI9S9_001426 [Planctomycetota bacterium]|jgi:hypothetical protein
MELAAFLSELQRHSLPTECQPATAQATDRDLELLHGALRKLDEAVRLDRPEELPELDVHAAVWATQQMHELWIALTAASDARTVPTPACPSDMQRPSTHFSVDLVLRHLPYLAGRADSLTANDARRQAIRELAATWPLSSVGIDGVTATSVTTLLLHDGLRRTYAERILRRRDDSRQQEPNVRRAVEEVMVEHRAFATEVLAVHDELTKQRPQ